MGGYCRRSFSLRAWFAFSDYNTFLVQHYFLVFVLFPALVEQ
jgi:hypothetical protein